MILRKTLSVLFALLLTLGVFAKAADDGDIPQAETYKAEFITVYEANGKKAEYKTEQVMHDGSAEDAEGVYEFLDNEITPDGDLKKEISKATGISVSAIKIVDRKVICRFADGSWSQDNQNGTMIVFDAAANTTTTYDQEGNEVTGSKGYVTNHKGSFELSITAQIKGKKTVYITKKFQNYDEAYEAGDKITSGEDTETNNLVCKKAGVPAGTSIWYIVSIDPVNDKSVSKTSSREAFKVHVTAKVAGKTFTKTMKFPDYNHAAQAIEYIEAGNDKDLINWACKKAGVPNTTPVTFTCEEEECDRAGSYKVMVKVEVNGKEYVYGEWSTFKTKAEADSAIKYVKYGKGKKEVTSWALCEADTTDPKSFEIICWIENGKKTVKKATKKREDLEIFVGKPECPKCKSLEKGYSNKLDSWFCMGCDYAFSKEKAAQIRSTSKATKAGQVYVEYTENPPCPECKSLKKVCQQGYFSCGNCDYSWGTNDPGDRSSSKSGEYTQGTQSIFSCNPRCPECGSQIKVVKNGKVYCDDCDAGYCFGSLEEFGTNEKKAARETVKIVCPNGCPKKFFKLIGTNDETMMDIYKCSKCGEKAEFPICAEEERGSFMVDVDVTYTVDGVTKTTTVSISAKGKDIYAAGEAIQNGKYNSSLIQAIKAEGEKGTIVIVSASPILC